ncbi:MAG: hypothetical protein M1824_002719, partial [Vezdaea acicularis]
GATPLRLDKRSIRTNSTSQPEVWRSAINVFLPEHLKELELAAPEIGAVRGQPKDLITLLQQARKQANIDVLTYMGVTKAQWPAVIWIAKYLLNTSDDGERKNPSVVEAHLLLPRHLTLAELSATASSDPSLARSYTSMEPYGSIALSYGSERNLLGESGDDRFHQAAILLPSLGNMVIAAAEAGADKAKVIMSYVLQMLAYLHHADILPNTLYNHSQMADPLTLQRPPTLHLLSSRILTALSDEVWRAQEEYAKEEAAAMGAKYEYMGFEIPGARYRLRVRELGPEVWLELILWACVDLGLVDEGASLLGEIKKRNNQDRWSVIDFRAIADPSQRQVPADSARIDWEAIRTRPGGAVGRFEGYSHAPPFVEMGARTISSEVVAAVIQGLIDSMSISAAEGLSDERAIDHIFVLKSLLDRDKYGLGPNSWNQVVSKLFEMQRLHPKSTLRLVERIVLLSPTYKKELEAQNVPSADEPDGPHHPYTLEQSAAAIGLLHYALGAYVQAGDIQGALRVFVKLQSMTDLNKEKAISEFLGKLKSQVRAEVKLSRRTNIDVTSPLDDIGSADDTSDVPGFFPSIPRHVLGPFLDLVTTAKVYEFGKWLIYAEEVDGPLISEQMYGNLAPSLLRFASATSDGDLLSKVSIKLRMPLPPSVVTALLQCHVSMGNWDRVEDLLGHVSTEVDLCWNAEDATILAQAILKSQPGTLANNKDNVEKTQNQKEALERPKAILASLLNGAYGLPCYPDAGTTSLPVMAFVEDTPLERSRLRTGFLRHINRVLGSSSPVIANLYSGTLETEPPRLITPSIPTSAFNILLDGVVENGGVDEGIRMWETWCLQPEILPENVSSSSNHPVRTPNGPELFDLNIEDEPFRLASRLDTDLGLVSQSNSIRELSSRLVKPNIETLNIIVSEILRKIAVANADSSAVPGFGISNNLSKLLEQDQPRIPDSLKWAVDKYERFGLTREEVINQIQGKILLK